MTDTPMTADGLWSGCRILIQHEGRGFYIQRRNSPKPYWHEDHGWNNHGSPALTFFPTEFAARQAATNVVCKEAKEQRQDKPKVDPLVGTLDRQYGEGGCYISWTDNIHLIREPNGVARVVQRIEENLYQVLLKCPDSSFSNRGRQAVADQELIREHENEWQDNDG